VSSPLYTPGDRYRLVQEPVVPSGGDEYRSPFRRDFGRIVHSSYFRRLVGKTQLFPPQEQELFRNRLTHSVEVAQIAKSIALRLNLLLARDGVEHEIDLDIVETGALAHDLGHPPFGHNGESALHKMMHEHGGFESNAQALRIAARLAKRTLLPGNPASARPFGIGKRGKDYRAGYNLTARSLLSFLKYDRMIPESSSAERITKGYYKDEHELVGILKERVSGATDPSQIKPFKTVECQIMDIADDIAYSTYDLEDAFKCAFLNPLDLITTEETELNELAPNVTAAIRKEHPDAEDVTVSQVIGVLIELFRDMFDFKTKSKAVFLITAYQSATGMVRDGYKRLDFTARCVGDLVGSVSIAWSSEAPVVSRVSLSLEARTRVEILKQLVWKHIIDAPRLQIPKERSYDIIREIFSRIEHSRGAVLPDEHREIYRRTPETGKKRVIADFISGMTDHYALSYYARLTSAGAEHFLEPVF